MEASRCKENLLIKHVQEFRCTLMDRRTFKARTALKMVGCRPYTTVGCKLSTFTCQCGVLCSVHFFFFGFLFFGGNCRFSFVGSSRYSPLLFGNFKFMCIVIALVNKLA